MKRRLSAALGVAMTLSAGLASAHVGMTAVVQEGSAGPYHLVVTIQPPDVVPGIASIDVRAFDDGVSHVSVVPLPISGDGAESPPRADEARPSREDAHLYTSSLWLMRPGSWKVRVTVDGSSGEGTLSVPVPVAARVTRPMPPFLTGLLFGLLVLLMAGAVAIVGASVRDADLPPGAAPDASRRASGRKAMIIAAAVLVFALAGGRAWWTSEARLQGRAIYRPLDVAAKVSESDGLRHLSLTLTDPGWLKWRRVDDLVPDHGHLMHLFLVRMPELDAIAHLHPALTGLAHFEQSLMPIPAGNYRLFGDIVHQTGLDETVTTGVDLVPPSPDTPSSTAFDPDDAMALIPRAATADDPAFVFPDGSGRLRWLPPGALAAGQTVALEFDSESAGGRTPEGIEPYMGMAGHAMIVARDFSLFAHIHPSGSVPMAALALVGGGGVADHSHHHGMMFAPHVQFPFVFPHAGSYRAFVQIKRDGKVETAAFDIKVGGHS